MPQVNSQEYYKVNPGSLWLGKDGLYRDRDGNAFQKIKKDEYKLFHGPKYIVFRGETIKLSYQDDRLWHAPDGTIFALQDEKAMVDKSHRCGIGSWSLSEDHPLTAACKVHDYMYSSPAFQLFYTRKEADKWLQSLAHKIADSPEGNPWYHGAAYAFRYLSHWFGRPYWENEDTR